MLDYKEIIQKKKDLEKYCKKYLSNMKLGNAYLAATKYESGYIKFTFFVEGCPIPLLDTERKDKAINAYLGPQEEAPSWLLVEFIKKLNEIESNNEEDITMLYNMFNESFNKSEE